MRTQQHYKWDGERREKGAEPTAQPPATPRLPAFARDAESTRMSLARQAQAPAWVGFIYKVVLPAVGFLAASAVTMRILAAFLHH
jgi:hypothetical protein